jgi:hypothetical protein
MYVILTMIVVTHVIYYMYLDTSILKGTISTSYVFFPHLYGYMENKGNMNCQ